MPITSSAKKAHRQSVKRRTENNVVKKTMKQTIKEFQTTVTADSKKAEEMIPQVYKAIDKAAKKGILKANTADRKKAAVARALKSE